MEANEKERESLSEIRNFYDSTYYGKAKAPVTPTRHLRKLARKIGIRKNQRVLDVACGIGEWLLACKERGATVSGVDLSTKAISICQKSFPGNEFYATPAESLPFSDEQFDIVTCLGSLEHFVSPEKALHEMVRVAKKGAIFVFVVPNADFLTRRLRLFSGTAQVDAKEEVRPLSDWQRLFEDSGLNVTDKWKDLHVLSWGWISLGRWYTIPVRAAQALALAVWPLKWQYQVYYQCIANDAEK